MIKGSDTQPPLKVGLISLGCAKNLVDAEIMIGSLLSDGLQVVSDTAEADVVIVNTCSFIDAAQEESVDTILQSAALREAHHRDQGLVVSGCLPQRFRGDLPRLMPEVDAFLGIDQVTQVSRIVREAHVHRRGRLALGHRKPSRQAKPPLGGGAPAVLPHTETTATAQVAPENAIFEVNSRPRYIPDFATPRFRLTPRHFAYVKIAEGCNHPCSFCIIPRMRGSHRSRREPDVVEEVRRLVDDGVREINLISQDTTYYGLDLRPEGAGAIAAPERFAAAVKGLPAGGTTLATLLQALEKVPGDFWVRLLYTHPAHWTDELIRTMADCRKVARYVDMPLQHIHDTMLERMRRETSRRTIEELIDRIRAGIARVALRTTFIVGFPGETEGCFESLIEFIRSTRFERLGVFTYSREEGTRAAKMQGQVPRKVSLERRDRAMAEQRAVARETAANRVGDTMRVLIESHAAAKELPQAEVSSWEHGMLRSHPNSAASPRLRGRWALARGEADAPDIDGRVYVRGRLPVGEFAEVRVMGHTDYDLMAEAANSGGDGAFRLT